MSARVLLGLAAMVALSRAAAGQESGSFTATLGNDTIYVESFTRTASTLEAFAVFRSPRTDLVHYVAQLRPDGSMERFDLHRLNPDGSARSPARTSTISFLADSLEVKNVRGDSTTTVRVAAPRHTVPMLHPWHSYSLLDVGLRQSLKMNGDSVPVSVYVLGGRAPFATMAFRDGKDAARIRWVGGFFQAHFAANGSLDGMNARETTVKTEAVLGRPVNVLALAREFARRDSAGGGIGPVSPRDTARSTIGSSSATIDYSRPSRRGRVIFGGLVPNGEPWRTGADAATQLELSGSVRIGGKDVPAGEYTIWLIPRPGADSLVVNSQNGQWGTQYDSAKDLVRVPVERRSLAPAVERFTISFEAGWINLDWSDTRFRVRIEPR
jgi:Protein of unknown function (DUF2911)